MTTLALLLVLSQVDPLDSLMNVQVTGWSADETKFSVRGFDLDTTDEAQECPGYTDHEGKKFVGKLVVAAYERGRLVQSWVVQDYPACTSPADAKATLLEAKAKFKKLGIDLSNKGTQLPCDSGCDVGHGQQLIFENGTSITEEEGAMQGNLSGRVRVYLTTAKGKTKLLDQKLDERFTLMMGGKMWVRVAAVERSPRGDAFFARFSIDSFDGRSGDYAKFLPLGYFAWNGESFVKGAVPKPYIPAPAPK